MILSPYGLDSWVLMEDHKVTTDSGFTITVPKGFVTDLDSVPRIPFVFFIAKGRTVESAVVHDYLYRTGLVSRKEADDIFYELMIKEGVSSFRSWYIYSAVRLFGGFSWKS